MGTGACTGRRMPTVQGMVRAHWLMLTGALAANEMR